MFCFSKYELTINDFKILIQKCNRNEVFKKFLKPGGMEF
jgi:hypothetical protein